MRQGLSGTTLKKIKRKGLGDLRIAKSKKNRRPPKTAGTKLKMIGVREDYEDAGEVIKGVAQERG